MKHVILAIVVVAALAVAGVGGVFATWADSEVSFNNTITTGAVDLKVNGEDDLPWGNGVPAKVSIDCMVPDKWYGPYEVELWNAGICNNASSAYIHVKKLVCGNAPPKVDACTGNTTGYPDPSTGQLYSGDLKPEPELVAEYGGKVDCTWVEGLGVTGDNCSMGSGVRMVITNTMVAPNEANADILKNADGMVMNDLLYKWVCKELYLFDLMPCQPRTIYLWFHLDQDSEEDVGAPNYIKSPEELGLSPGDDGYADAWMHWKKFNDWPSWRYMRDMATFDMEFDLVLWYPNERPVSPDGSILK
jgi:predicted ribosomally synthesized peptide with SipW-like signal peptide